MISISISRIIEGAMAESALRASCGMRQRPDILTTDHTQALRRATRDVAARLIMRILKVVESSNIATINPETDDIITLSLKIRSEAEAMLLPTFEDAVTAGLLSVCYGTDKVGTSDRTAFDSLADHLAHMALVTMPKGIRRSA